MKHGLGKRFEERTKSNIVLLLVTVAASLLSALLLFGSTGIGLVDWARRTLDWRDQEYEKLKSLHAGYTRAKFQSVLGEPVFDRRSRDGRFREQTFRRPEYCVQTVSTRSGMVVVYSITACGHHFRPTFNIPGGANRDEPGAQVELNVSTLASVVRPRYEPRLDYYGTAATGNSRFQEIFDAGNPSNYKTFVWGINDVCPDWFDEVYPTLTERAGGAVLIFKGQLSGAPGWAGMVRNESAVNTDAETAPLFDLSQLHGAFQVGADRILTRTTAEGLG